MQHRVLTGFSNLSLKVDNPVSKSALEVNFLPEGSVKESAENLNHAVSTELERPLVMDVPWVPVYPIEVWDRTDYAEFGHD